MAPKRLILGVTIGGSSRLLDGQAKYFKDLGYEVYLISQNHYKEGLFCEKEGITHLPVDIIADISPLKDLRSLFQIIKSFRQTKPDIINVGTPKMALLALIAAWILGVKHRIYTCRGLRFETEKGFTKFILISMERLSVLLAHQVIYVSPSLLSAAENNKVCNRKKSVVIGKGSSNGVDITTFNFDKIDKNKRNQLMKEFQLENTLVIGFVGRVTLHKGAYELVNAFEKIHAQNPNTRLVLMGHVKCDETFEARFRSHPGIIHIPFQDNVPLYMSMFDIFVLPSWREGFPNVPIQAAAMGIPVIVSDATGCLDSVAKNENGFIFKTRNEEDLVEKLKLYIGSDELRKSHGAKGIEWAKNFRSETVWNGIETIYKQSN